MATYLVKPTEPTILSHKEYHEVSSINLLLSMTVSTTHIIPEILDIERFNTALSKALSSFPHLAGRLVRPDTPGGPWKIRLTNSGVPVSVLNNDTEEITPTDSAVQTPLHLVEPLNVAGVVNADRDSDEPLFRLTITRFTKLHSTAIGTCNSHVLFDGTGFLLFLDLLSQFYQGFEPVNPPPYYEPGAMKFLSPQKPPLPIFDIFDPSALPPWEQPERKAMELVVLRMTPAQLTEIHDAVTKGSETLRVSRVDVVVALLARCLTDVEPESKPIDTIWNVINHRGMGIYPANAVVNAIFWLPTNFPVSKVVDPREDILACAVEMRKSLGKLKNPEFIKDMAAGVAETQSQVAWNRKRQDTATAQDGCLIVNNTWRFPWTSPHFGHPGKVMFLHGHAPGSRYVKIMTPNPRPVEGTWVDREGGMEVTLYVPPNRRRLFRELFGGCVKGFGVTGAVEFLV